jgi:hypothetical protein
MPPIAMFDMKQNLPANSPTITYKSVIFDKHDYEKTSYNPAELNLLLGRIERENTSNAYGYNARIHNSDVIVGVNTNLTDRT